MKYWVARAKPANSKPFEDWLIPERIGHWWTKKPPSNWEKGDRVFVWASKPRLAIVGLAELNRLQSKPDDEGLYWYRLRYRTNVLKKCIALAALRANPLMSKSILLKQGPSASVVRLTEDEARELYSLVVRQNPLQKSVWPTLLTKVTASISPLPDVDYDGNEGSRVLRRHLQIERDHKLVKAKKRAVLAATGHLACEVCDFDFYATYGERGKGFCEAHHIKVLAVGGQRKTTPADLAVVCSNCHRIMHRGGSVLNVKQMKRLMKGNA